MPVWHCGEQFDRSDLLNKCSSSSSSCVMPVWHCGEPAATAAVAVAAVAAAAVAMA
jgi:hypothetical protein